MQPYFMPYAGYFRLFAAADLFVIYDCVQFPRRGWVHRNRLLDAQRQLRWLTLPLAHADVATSIADLHFRPHAQAEFDAQLPRFPALQAHAPGAAHTLRAVRDLSGAPVDYLERTLAHSCGALGLPFNTVRSSRLGVPGALRGQARILAILKALSATAYVNAPGGAGLYSAADFAAQGIALRFLPPWQGDASSILQRLLTEPPQTIGQDIHRQCTAQSAG